VALSIFKISDMNIPATMIKAAGVHIELEAIGVKIMMSRMARESLSTSSRRSGTDVVGARSINS